MEHGIGIVLILLVIFVGHALSDLFDAKTKEIKERTRQLKIGNTKIKNSSYIRQKLLWMKGTRPGNASDERRHS